MSKQRMQIYSSTLPSARSDMMQVVSILAFQDDGAQDTRVRVPVSEILLFVLVVQFSRFCQFDTLHYSIDTVLENCSLHFLFLTFLLYSCKSILYISITQNAFMPQQYALVMYFALFHESVTKDFWTKKNVVQLKKTGYNLTFSSGHWKLIDLLLSPV